MKVETHNHLTAFSPWPGLRLVLAVKFVMRAQLVLAASLKLDWWALPPKTCVFPVLNSHGKAILVSCRIVNALDIMLEGPLGGAAFNNEFGRPNLLG